MTGYCIILTTTDSEEVAENIATELVSEDIAACVQIDKIKSFYKWEERLQNSHEYRLAIKALSLNYQLIEQKITKLHNYQTPQILKIDISGGASEYLNWLVESTILGNGFKR